MLYKHALVLSGGGANGAYQNGAIQRLAKAIKAGDYPEPDLVVGTSVGALNGSKLCEFPMGMFDAAAEAVDAEWSRLNGNSDVYKPHLWGMIPSALLMFVFKCKNSVYNTTPIQNHVRSNLSAAKIASSDRKFACNAIGLQGSAETTWFQTGDPDIVEGVLASSSYPIFFEPINIRGKWYTDGGLRDQTGLGYAIEMGAERVDVISCSTGKTSNKEGLPKGLDHLLRDFEIALHENDDNDFKKARLVNELVKSGSSLAEERGWRIVELNELRPSKGVGNGLDFSRGKNSRLRAIGYEDADRFLREGFALSFMGHLSRRVF